ncbi:MAG TPA: PH domain-containing protein [Gemmataceae bacterium]|nr:PH domain-containing protein [Gemmataceae bacterium]
MRSPPLLTFALMAVGVLGLLGLLAVTAARGRPIPAAGQPSVLVRHSPGFRLFAFLAALSLPVGLTILFTIYPPNRDETAYVLGAFVVVVPLTVALYWEAVRYYVYATAQGIEGRSPWRGARYFAWDDIREVTFNPAAGWFAFQAWDGDRIRVHWTAVGVKDLLHLVETHIPAAMVQKARPGWDRLGRPLPRPSNEPVLEARRPWRPGE